MDEKWIKLEGIKVPDVVWKALRDNNLVIFAGAGVSMEKPANLPDFKGLAKKMEQKTGVSLLKEEKEREEVFFGRLKDCDIDVHTLAARIFSERSPEPTETHKNILRLYPKDEVRIVTTNFDLLFECASQEAFSTEVNIETFDAPALPSGKRFNGIVHVHGSVSHCDEMVLTDRDFGRTYLTEGCSRRFLVDLFNEFTVLFIGYSHNDAIMVNLARALPRSEKQRFVLTGKNKLEREHWERLGITPVLYNQSNKRDHVAVDKLIRRSADLVGYSIFDWREKIRDIAKTPPSRLGEEEASLIKIALGDKIKTRFFARFATSYEWIKWLDECGYLDALFRGRDLNDRELELCDWLVEKFASSHSNHLFSLICKHQMRLNLEFWRVLGRGIANKDKGSLDGEVLSKWVSVLLETLPSRTQQDKCVHVMHLLGKQCGKYDLSEDLLRIFEVMSADSYIISDSRRSLVSVGNERALKTIWENLEPNIEKVAEPLLDQVANRLRGRHFKFSVLERADRSRDPDTSHRSAIEPHEQNRHREAVDVLIDIARDCLASLASTRKKEAIYWCNRLKLEKAPILRRLAVHTFFTIENLPPDDKVSWLLENIGLYDAPVHHETFMAMKQVYSGTSPTCRKRVIETVLTYREEDEEPLDDVAQVVSDKSAYEHYTWLHWLNEAASDCEVTKNALAKVQDKHPDFRPRKYPDLPRWSEVKIISPQSPWTAEDLLKKHPGEWLQELLSFSGEYPDGRYGLRLAVEEAAKSDFKWGYDLAETLSKNDAWDTDLWDWLMQVWGQMSLDESGYSKVMAWLGHSELYLHHEKKTAEALCALVENNDAAYTSGLLYRTNKIAMSLWRHIAKTITPEEMPPSEWSGLAISRSAGMLTEFWLESLLIWCRNQPSAPDALDDEYRNALSEIVQDRTLAGKLGRVILAGKFSFLLGVDEKWTKDNILPLFDSDDDFQAVWDGFLASADLTPDAAQTLNKAIFKAAKKIGSDLIPKKDRFVELYVIMLESFVEDRNRWIVNLFDYGDEEIKHYFVSAIECRLRQKNPDQQREYWEHWLKEYWEDRLDCFLPPLTSQESEEMLNWLLSLESVFPEAVELVCRMPLDKLKDGLAIHDLESENELINGYPEAMTKLMIRLEECSMPLDVQEQISKIIEKIPQEKILSETKQKLRELKAKIGVDCPLLTPSFS